MGLTLDNGWQVQPIDGDTGTAYMGFNNEEKLFLKRNTSPFLLALSMKEITPRLVWSKRMLSGDTLTAQEWQNGRCLHKNEMQGHEVASLVYRVHHTPILKKMLSQVGGKVLTPYELLNQYFRGLSSQLRIHPLLKNTANWLRANQPTYERSNYEVCHGDLNHKNMLLSDSGKLYLVDWESAVIADPAYDLSVLMYKYVPREKWQEWLEKYYSFGKQKDAGMQQRIIWYRLVALLLAIKDYSNRGRFYEMNQDITKLSQIISEEGLK